MSQANRLNRAIQSELQELYQEGVLTEEQRETIGLRYPATPFNEITIVRWFSILGVLSMCAGLLFLANEVVNVVRLLETVGHFLLKVISFGYVQELAVALLSGLFFYGGRSLHRQGKYPRVGAAAQLVGCFGLTALTLLVGKRLSTGSGNWPVLIGLDTILFVALAYVLHNRLVLIYATINAFVWFGGQTGYISGWGAYWLGLSYPLRFVAAGLVSTWLGWVHFYRTWEQLKPYTNFSRVYFHFGLLSLNLSLWMLSLFGNVGRGSWSSHTGERVLFTFLWFGVCFALFKLGTSKNIGLLRLYGIVFVLINAYTAYFQYIAANSAGLWFLHMLVAGGSMLFLVKYLEKRGIKLSFKDDVSEESPELVEKVISTL